MTADLKKIAAVKHATVDRLNRDKRLSLIAKAVGRELYTHANNATALAWPSQKRLAELVDRTERWVRSAIAELKYAGYITARFDGRSNVYRVFLVDEKPDLGRGATVQATGSNDHVESSMARRRRHTGNRKNTSYAKGSILPTEPLNEPKQESEVKNPKGNTALALARGAGAASRERAQADKQPQPTNGRADDGTIHMRMVNDLGLGDELGAEVLAGLSAKDLQLTTNDYRRQGKSSERFIKLLAAAPNAH